MAYDNGVYTGLECKAVGIWCADDVYKHDTKIWIARNVSRYRTYMT